MCDELKFNRGHKKNWRLLEMLNSISESGRECLSNKHLAAQKRARVVDKEGKT
jgi:hypothetical protein